MQIDSIMVVPTGSRRGVSLIRELSEAGWPQVAEVSPSEDVMAEIRDQQPSVVILDLGIPDARSLAQAFQVARDSGRPTVVFVDRTDESAIEDAIEAGVATYVVGGLRHGRIRPIVETAVTRFRMFERLRRERDDAMSALSAFFGPVGR